MTPPISSYSWSVFFCFSIFLFSSTVLAIDLDPGGDTIRKGLKDFQKEDFESSQKSFESAESYFPKDPRLAFNRGSASYKVGDYSSALQSFSQSLELSKDPKLSSDAYYNLGNTYAKLGDMKKAGQSYAQSLKLNPKQENARKNLELLQKQSENSSSSQNSSPSLGGSEPKEGEGDSQNSEEQSTGGNQQGRGQNQGQNSNGNGSGNSGEEKKDGQSTGQDPSQKGGQQGRERDPVLDSLGEEKIQRRQKNQKIFSREREVFW